MPHVADAQQHTETAGQDCNQSDVSHADPMVDARLFDRCRTINTIHDEIAAAPAGTFATDEGDDRMMDLRLRTSVASDELADMAAGIAPPIPTGDDAPLIAASNRHTELERQIKQAINVTHADDDDAGDTAAAPLQAEQEELLDAIEDMPIRSMAGLLAVAGALREYRNGYGTDHGPHDFLLDHLLEGAAALSLPQAAGDDDADLIALGAEIDRVACKLNVATGTYAQCMPGTPEELEVQQLIDTLTAQQTELGQTIAARPCAKTLAGVQARAAALEAARPPGDPEQGYLVESWERGLLLAVLADIQAIGPMHLGTASPVIADTASDVELQRLRDEAALTSAIWNALPGDDRDEANEARYKAAMQTAGWLEPRSPAGIAAKAGLAIIRMRADGIAPVRGRPTEPNMRLIYDALWAASRLSPGPTLAPDADDALIADCAAFDVLEARIQQVRGSEPVNDAARNVLGYEQDPLADRIITATATTLAGHQARARVVLAFTRQTGPASGLDQHLMAALLRDLVAGAAA